MLNYNLNDRINTYIVAIAVKVVEVWSHEGSEHPF